MSRFFGVLRHEFTMSMRRPGMWIAYGLVLLFYSITVMYPVPEEQVTLLTDKQIWQYAGQMAFTFNLFLPVMVGILSADRLQRDFRMGVRELQASTPLHLVEYTLGKYFGVLIASLTPVLIWLWLITGLFIAFGNAPIGFFFIMTLAFFAIMVPAFAFVTAFSLACPLIMPLRVYQILFTGYWFWGNYISPEFFPTLNGTLLTVSGLYSYQGFFGGFINAADPLRYSAADATLNLIVLGLCIVAVLVVLNHYLRWQMHRA
jgi:ABC-type transport system involved in multi-copper enzyme maturation permease subunit